jgi:hypothetical protein
VVYIISREFAPGPHDSPEHLVVGELSALELKEVVIAEMNELRGSYESLSEGAPLGLTFLHNLIFRLKIFYVFLLPKIHIEIRLLALDSLNYEIFHRQQIRFDEG